MKMIDENDLHKLIREMIFLEFKGSKDVSLRELHVNTGWIRKSVRTLLPTIGFDPYMVWNRSYNDSFTKRRLEAIENVHHAFKGVWMKQFNEEIDPDASEKAYRHAANYWRSIWTAAGKDEEKAKKRMLQKLIKVYIIPEINRKRVKLDDETQTTDVDPL